jgi:glycine/D-amino acid oxidase-like deaminating enzyme
MVGGNDRLGRDHLALVGHLRSVGSYSRTVLDVLVVGGGVIGSSIAYHLARAGARVRVYEQAAPAVAPSASWASAGGVRQQGRDAREWPLTLEAARRWPNLDQELGAATGFVQGGHLHVVEAEADIAALEQRVQNEAAAGMNIRMLEPAAIYQVSPALKPGVLAAAFTPDDGQADPRRTTAAFAAAAERHGAEYFNGAHVDGLLEHEGRVRGIRVQAQDVTADAVVLATGVWTNTLTRPLGCEVAIEPRAPQMLLTTPGPRQLAPTLTAVDRALSLKQLPSGEYFIGGGWPTDIVEGDNGPMCRVRPDSIAGSWSVATEIVPAVADQRVADSWGGLEAQSVDGVPFLGPAPGLEGAFLAVGFSGHGFQLSPAVGRAIAALLGGAHVPELDQVSSLRTPVPEPSHRGTVR